MNILIASGHLGGDPETKITNSGTAMTTFSLPVRQGWGDNEKTTWVRGVLFGKKGTGEPHGLAKYLSKGKLITVQGEIVLDEWTDKEGNARSTLSCLVREMVVPKDGSPVQPKKEAQPEPIPDGFADEDLPF